MIIQRILTFGAALCLVTTVSAQSGRDIIEATGVTGGVVVHLGCGDGRLTTELAIGESFLVQGLDRSESNVAAARRRILAQGLAGQVSADRLATSSLPYTDNLVSLIVGEDVGDVPSEEIDRVLSPGGVAYLKKDGKWSTMVKAWPDDIDEWTHYLHDASGNAVADDRQVGPPRHMQWLASPSWIRHHHALASVSAVVSSQGRIFFIADEGSTAAVEAPGKWAIFARDAFNGVLLWKRPITQWADHLQGFRSGPVQLERVLVASGDRVYATLELDAAVSILEATSGEVLAVCEGTEKAEEIILQGDTLYVLTGAPVSEQMAAAMIRRGEKGAAAQVSKTIVAVDAATGRRKWAKVMKGPAKPVAQTLAADERNVYFQTLTEAVALDGKTGEKRWTCVTAEAAPPQAAAKGKGRKKTRKPGVKIGWSTATLVVNDGVVLTANESAIHAISTADGRKLWSSKCSAGFKSPPDVLVVRGIVWAGPNFSDGRDLETGEVVKTISYLDDLRTAGHHHRCYRDKATTEFLLGGYRGIEFMDLEGDHHSRNNWIRGVCQYGVMPANGLIYAPPHQCACFIEAKLYGFWAVAAGSDSPTRFPEAAPRLTKGSAFGTISKADNTAPDPEAWPMQRQGPRRGNAATTVLPGNLHEQWATEIGGSLTPPVAANGKVVLARREAGEIVALDEDTGDVSWRSSAAGGRIDSAPTIHRGLVLFGSADGRVYCLRLDDGTLLWKFRAAPADRQTVAFDQLESLWPVHGSVLVQNGTAYFTAGRTSYLDGGLRLFGLDPWTGEIRMSETLVNEPAGVDLEGRERIKRQTLTQNATDYKTFTAPDRSDAFSMAGSMSDILVGDGESLYLRQTRYNRDGEAQSNGMHLFSTSRLVDGDESQRSYMVYGSGDFSRTPVAFSWIADGRSFGGKQLARPYGVTMAFDDTTAFCVRSHWSRTTHQGYRLHVWDLRDGDLTDASVPDFRVPKEGHDIKPAWEVDLDVRPRCILRSGDRLYLGGMPNEEGGVTEDALDGMRGGVISILSAADGSRLGGVPLATAPVWEGLAAANRRLIVSGVDGIVRCLGE